MSNLSGGNVKNIATPEFRPVMPDSHAVSTFVVDYDMRREQIDARVSELIRTYIDNAVDGTRRILANKKKLGYIRAVQKELPGAPHSARHGTLHCLYGQSTQLKRALAKLNDSIKIIPSIDNAHQSSLAFKRQMAKLYDNPKYPGAIRRGNIYTTDAEYNRALERYLSKTLRGKHGNLDSLRSVYTADFAKNNYPASALTPGAILIVGGGHAVMYLGQGRIVNSVFVPDANGSAVCCSYNAEHAAISLNVWNTHNTFAADIAKIASVEYENELARADELRRTENVNNNDVKTLYVNDFTPITARLTNMGHDREQKFAGFPKDTGTPVNRDVLNVVARMQQMVAIRRNSRSA